MKKIPNIVDLLAAIVAVSIIILAVIIVISAVIGAIILTGAIIYFIVPLDFIKPVTPTKLYLNYFINGFVYWDAIVFFHYPNWHRYLQIIITGIVLLLALVILRALFVA